MKRIFLFFLFFPFICFSGTDTITVTGIPWNSSAGKNSGYQIKSVPVTLTFVSGDSGTGVKCGSVWLLSPGDTTTITSEYFVGAYVFCSSSGSSPDPSSATFSCTYPGDDSGGGDSGGGDSGGGDSGGGDSGGGDSTNAPWALESTLQSFMHSNSGDLNSVKDSIDYTHQYLQDYLDSFNTVNDSIDDLDTLLRQLYSRVENVDLNLSSVSDKMDSVNDGLSKLDERLEDLLDEVKRTNSPPSVPPPPSTLPFDKSRINRLKAKLLPNYSFFGSVSGNENPPTLAFDFAPISDASLEFFGSSPFIGIVALRGDNWADMPNPGRVLGLSLSDLMLLVRTLLKVLVVYFFLKVCILTIQRF